MPRYVVTSDWHIQNTGKFAKPIEGGLTTRARHTFDFIEWLWDYCEQNEIEKILHCGDFFTQRGLISAPLYNRFWDLLTTCPVPILMIVGNHDRYKADPSIHGMYVLGHALDNVTVLENQIAMDASIRVAGCPPPFDDSLKLTCPKGTKRNILLIHENIIGAQFESGAKADKGVSREVLIEWMRKNNYDICFCGDIHVPQEMTAWNPQIIIVGAPYQMNFGDAGQKRGIWIYESEKHTVEFVVYEEGPNFYQITDDNFTDFKAAPAHTNDYFQFKLGDLENYRTIQDYVKTVDWTGYDIQFVANTNSDGKEFSVSDLYDSKEVIPVYVKNEVEEISRRFTLIERGLGYIQEVLKEKGEQSNG